MRARVNPLVKETNVEYFTCGRCSIDSLTVGRMCPCPRGGCEAKVMGSVRTEIKRTIFYRQEWYDKHKVKRKK